VKNRRVRFSGKLRLSNFHLPNDCSVRIKKEQGEGTRSSRENLCVPHKVLERPWLQDPRQNPQAVETAEIHRIAPWKNYPAPLHLSRINFREGCKCIKNRTRICMTRD
jgi:hypothetical protein